MGPSSRPARMIHSSVAFRQEADLDGEKKHQADIEAFLKPLGLVDHADKFDSWGHLMFTKSRTLRHQMDLPVKERKKLRHAVLKWRRMCRVKERFRVLTGTEADLYKYTQANAPIKDRTVKGDAKEFKITRKLVNQRYSALRVAEPRQWYGRKRNKRHAGGFQEPKIPDEGSWMWESMRSTGSGYNEFDDDHSESTDSQDEENIKTKMPAWDLGEDEDDWDLDGFDENGNPIPEEERVVREQEDDSEDEDDSDDSDDEDESDEPESSSEEEEEEEKQEEEEEEEQLDEEGNPIKKKKKKKKYKDLAPDIAKMLNGRGEEMARTLFEDDDEYLKLKRMAPKYFGTEADEQWVPGDPEYIPSDGGDVEEKSYDIDNRKFEDLSPREQQEIQYKSERYVGDGLDLDLGDISEDEVDRCLFGSDDEKGSGSDGSDEEDENKRKDDSDDFRVR